MLNENEISRLEKKNASTNYQLTDFLLQRKLSKFKIDK